MPMIDLSQFKVWTEEEFDLAFPDVPVSSNPNGAARGAQGGNASAGAIDEASLPDDLLDLIRNGVTREKDRSRFFMGAIAGLKERGASVDAIFDLLSKYPGGIASKYLRPNDRLRREIERVYAKLPDAPPIPPVPITIAPMYDSHHAIVGTLGDRFVLFRIEAMPDEQLEKCQLGLGERTSVERELTQAAADLLASLPDPLPAPQRMNTGEYAALKRVIRLAIRLRAGVVRDAYKRDIDDVHDPEGPARLILALQQLFAGLVLIGIARDEACRILEQAALDSTPRLRLKAFNGLTDDWHSTSEIAAEVNLPRMTMKRVLEDLTAQKLAVREEKVKLLPRGKGRSFSGDVECWKRTAAAKALT
jgi:hypothetical protein